MDTTTSGSSSSARAAINEKIEGKFKDLENSFKSRALGKESKQSLVQQLNVLKKTIHTDPKYKKLRGRQREKRKNKWEESRSPKVKNGQVLFMSPPLNLPPSCQKTLNVQFVIITAYLGGKLAEAIDLLLKDLSDVEQYQVLVDEKKEQIMKSLNQIKRVTAPTSNATS